MNCTASVPRVLYKENSSAWHTLRVCVFVCVCEGQFCQQFKEGSIFPNSDSNSNCFDLCLSQLETWMYTICQTCYAVVYSKHCLFLTEESESDRERKLMSHESSVPHTASSLKSLHSKYNGNSSSLINVSPTLSWNGMGNIIPQVQPLLYRQSLHQWDLTSNN